MLSGSLLAGTLWTAWERSWINATALSNPVIGINFSCNHAEYLILEARGESIPDDRPGRAEWCAETLGEILSRTGANHVRLSVEWSEVERAPGEYDFTLLDALLRESKAHGTSVLLTVGIKAQRHPEYYVPAWLIEMVDLEGTRVLTDRPEIRAPALAMVRAVAQHAAGSPVIEAWGAENEPYVDSSRGEFWSEWTIGRDFVQEVVAILRETDPLQRPIMVNDAQTNATHQNWPTALEDGDILGTSMYPFRNVEFFGVHFVVNVFKLGPLGANYASQARTATAQGKELWVTELQAEPWSDGDMRLISPENPSPNLSPEKLLRNVEYGRRSGAARLYLWGAEWWLFQELEYGNSSWLDTARSMVEKSEAAWR